jgi:hypothetical protein
MIVLFRQLSSEEAMAMIRSIRWVFFRVISITLLLAVSAPACGTNLASSPFQDPSHLNSWVIYSFPFIYIGQEENNVMTELIRIGHEQLAAEITDLTSMRKPSMRIRFSQIDSARIASLIEEIQSLGELPQDERLRINSIRPKYVIIPKYWIYSGRAAVLARISPFPRGIMTNTPNMYFGPENQLSGIQGLAKTIVCEMYQNENIHFADLERNVYRVGFRTFSQRGSNPAFKTYLDGVPEMLHTFACRNALPSYLEIIPFRPQKEDEGKKDIEYAKINRLDYVVGGTITDSFGIIGTKIVGQNGNTVQTFDPIEIQNSKKVMMDLLAKQADEIIKCLKSHTKSNEIAERSEQ